MAARSNGVIATWLLSLSFVASAAAQDAAGTFEELRFKVKVGDTVYVTNEAGKEREARIVDLSASSLTIAIGGERSEVSESQARRIRQRLPDSLVNGAVAGFLVGGASMAGLAKSLESPDGSCAAACVSAAALVYGGLGSLVGMGIDAMRKGKKTIYEPRQPLLGLALRPMLFSRTGVVVDIRF